MRQKSLENSIEKSDRESSPAETSVLPTLLRRQLYDGR